MTLSPRDSRRHSWQPSMAIALPWNGVLGTSYGVMVLNWFTPANVFRGGGEHTPITLPRPLTPRDSRGISGMPSPAKPERSGSRWLLLSGEKLTGFFQSANRDWLYRAVRVCVEETPEDTSKCRGRKCTPWSGALGHDNSVVDLMQAR